eukprot:359519-Chlamydomonas_euryale.AAC.3
MGMPVQIGETDGGKRHSNGQPRTSMEGASPGIRTDSCYMHAPAAGWPLHAYACLAEQMRFLDASHVHAYACMAEHVLFLHASHVHAHVHAYACMAEQMLFLHASHIRTGLMHGALRSTHGGGTRMLRWRPPEALLAHYTHALDTLLSTHPQP